MSGTRLTLRVGTLNKRHAFLRIYSANGTAGEALVERRHLEEIAHRAVETGDQLTVEVRLRAFDRRDERLP